MSVGPLLIIDWISYTPDFLVIGTGVGGRGGGAGFGGATLIGMVVFGRIYSTGSGRFQRTPIAPQKHRRSIPMKPNRSRVMVSAL